MLEPNETYWNPDRKPKARIVYDNKIGKTEAIKSVAAGDGRVDVVFDLTTEEAHAFQSDKGKIQTKAARTQLCGVFNENKPNSPWANLDVRKAANLALDRARIIRDGAYGWASEMPVFILPSRYGFDDSLVPYSRNLGLATKVFADKGIKEITIVASPSFEKVVGEIGKCFAEAGVEVKPVITKDDPPDGWDIKLEWYFDWSPQYPVGVVHREFFGKSGILRQSPEDPAFDALYEKLLKTVKQPDQENVVKEVERYCYNNAKALFLYAPHRLFAVSNRTDFTAYDTCMSELAETTIKG